MFINGLNRDLSVSQQNLCRLGNNVYPWSCQSGSSVSLHPRRWIENKGKSKPTANKILNFQLSQVGDVCFHLFPPMVESFWRWLWGVLRGLLSTALGRLHLPAGSPINSISIRAHSMVITTLLALLSLGWIWEQRCPLACLSVAVLQKTHNHCGSICNDLQVTVLCQGPQDHPQSWYKRRTHKTHSRLQFITMKVYRFKSTQRKNAHRGHIQEIPGTCSLVSSCSM